ncbi:tRNA (N(6)-L-threonylcarbamoyladenosine(37)-C(2))-methylthiotransferase [Methanohalophilus sp.]|uniref:tRNA (N(6)-L-threonylcarbamoyladenosine(37)-C(2))- methylthiotransferase n=1 Tax=Methanohalophilus sp. TaxID=1966352 RepID=UPI002610309E|nr:tRNA (N(6)-L-threonylcarbamoyladenosine(37)-C(2))-methylthiotransferase [Methanohalophilus sp.]MDK2893141.1 threonylcarbamoyladenosine tRNA methylthiotransferase [Methanohalophilus sp.]
MKVYLATFGCAANQSSSEIMAARILEKGHSLTLEADAEVVVCNTCTVKYATEQKILHKIRQWGIEGKEVLVTGCMPQVQLEDILETNSDVHVLGINSIADVCMALERIESGDKRLRILTSVPEDFLNVPRKRFHSSIHICQISQGCDNSCSYCIVTLARGPLKSFEPNAIVEDIRQAITEGCREIWLTSQDAAQYGNDIGTNIGELLKRISALEGDFRIRVGMMNPSSVNPILEELIEAFSDPKIYKLLHLPIQSASNMILRKMNRRHTIEDANRIIRRFRETFPESTIFTDIIVGFPGESDKDAALTEEWVKQIRPDKVNISRYTPRPHTIAWNFRNIDSRIVVERSGRLHKLCDSIKLESKKKKVGWKGEVFVSKKAKVKGFMTRTDAYHPVVIPQEEGITEGQRLTIEITDVTPGYFIGRVC